MKVVVGNTVPTLLIPWWWLSTRLLRSGATIVSHTSWNSDWWASCWVREEVEEEMKEGEEEERGEEKYKGRRGEKEKC